MPVSFSYENFPNLWDTIIESADHNTQLAIRALSKAHRLVIDRLQAEHLIVSTEGHEHTVATSPHHHLPHFREEAHIFDEQRFWANDMTRDLTARTRVLDIQGYSPPVYDPDLLLFMRFPALEVLRMTNSIDDHTPVKHFHPWIPPGEFYPAQTLVLFSNEAGMDGLMEHWWFEGAEDDEDEDEDEDWGAPSKRMFPERFFLGPMYLPPTVTKLVINMCGEDIQVEEMWPFMTEILPAHVRQIVVVGPRYQSLDGPGLVGDLTLGLVHDLVQIAFNPRAERVTFVGFEYLDPAFRNAFEAMLRQAIHEAIYEDVDYAIDDAATLALSSEERELFIRRSKKSREQGNGPNADGDDDEDEDEGERDETDSEGRDGAVGGKDVEDEPEPEEEGSAVQNGGKEDGMAEAGSPLLSYQQKIDQLLASYEFVTKQTYIDRVGEETAKLDLLEYLDPRDHNYRRGRHWRHKY